MERFEDAAAMLWLAAKITEGLMRLNHLECEPGSGLVARM